MLHEFAEAFIVTLGVPASETRVFVGQQNETTVTIVDNDGMHNLYWPIGFANYKKITET